jgi:hypothetical protein
MVRYVSRVMFWHLEGFERAGQAAEIPWIP